jgi:hypothetical protein
MSSDPAFAAAGRFHRGNLHAHSTRSDGALEPESVCAFYRDAGYDFIALSDHFLPKYRFPVTDTRPMRSEGFTTLLAAEVHTTATALGEMWHLLAVGLPPDFEATAAGEHGPALAARCREAGAWVVLVHPGWYGLTAADADTIPDAHAVEIYNHTSQVHTDRGDGSFLVDQLLAQGRRLSLCATDDAHFHEADQLGGWVMVKAEANDPALLLDALKGGRYYSSQGPVIEDVVYHPDRIEVRCSAARAVIALGRGSASSRELGEGLVAVSLPRAPLERGGYARIVVVDAAGRRAWTNPVWF